MLRLIGAVMICGGCTMIGLSAANRLSLRLKVITAWVSTMDFMKAEIEFLLTPVNELLDKCAKSAHRPLGEFFAECKRELEEDCDLSFSEAWSTVLSKADYLHMDSKEMQILEDLGNTLGRYDAIEQTGRIENLRRSMAVCAQSAQHEKAGLAKLYSSLGVACGIAMIIVFI